MVRCRGTMSYTSQCESHRQSRSTSPVSQGAETSARGAALLESSSTSRLERLSSLDRQSPQTRLWAIRDQARRRSVVSGQGTSVCLPDAGRAGARGQGVGSHLWRSGLRKHRPLGARHASHKFEAKTATRPLPQRPPVQRPQPDVHSQGASSLPRLLERVEAQAEGTSSRIGVGHASR